MYKRQTTESFRYDQSFVDPPPIVSGASTICEITYPIETNPSLDEVLSPIPYGCAFAGVSDITYVQNTATNKRYVYGVAQLIKRNRTTTSDLSNSEEAGAALFEVNLSDSTCRIIKQWAFVTNAARSLVVHQGELWWFEGSHYGNHRRDDRRYPAHLGNVFSLEAGTTLIRNRGVTRRSQFSYPEYEGTDYGFHTQMASPMISNENDLYLISGFGGLESINSLQYPTSQREQNEVEAETEIGNWMLVKHGRDIEQRIELFNANGKNGWDAINELCVVTNSFMGFDRYGNFFYKPKGGIHGRVQSSAPASIEFKDETDVFPQKGMIAINDELISYDGIFGQQFLNLTRGVSGTQQGTHCPDSIIYVIEAVLNTNEPIFDPIHNADIRDTAQQLYNKVVITYGDNTFDYQDDASIQLFGEKVYEMELPLTIHQEVWVEEIARRFINAYKDMHYLITLRIKETFAHQVADVVFLQIPERALLTRACQVYEVNSNPLNRETEVILRTL